MDDNILEILGVIPPPQPKGDILHSEISERWSETLKKGLKKEEKEDIIKQYPPFQNIPTMLAPKLNPEISAALNDSVKKRDNIIENRQKQLSAILSCLGSALQLSIMNDIEENRMTIIKRINDASRLLCDALFLDTRGRRSLILSVINKNLKDFLIQTEPETYLFGENLTEKIKTAKSVQKSSQELRIPDSNKKLRQNNSSAGSASIQKNNASRALNWRGPPRQGARTQTQRPAAGGLAYNKGPRKDKKKEDKTPQHYRK